MALSRVNGPRAKTVVIAGASAGIGRAAAREFARQGYRIGLIARSEDRLKEAAVEMERLGSPRAYYVQADVGEADQVEHAAERFEAELGPVDVWVNNAMLTIYSRFLDIEPEEYDQITRVTYLGQVNGTRAALKRMAARRRGRIVCVSSGLAYRAVPLQSAYCAAKFAIRGFVESVRSEVIHENYGVDVSMVHLPGVNTPQFDWAPNRTGKRPKPVEPIFQPEVPARAILRAAETGERDVYVGLPALQLLLGSAYAPRLLDSLLAKQGWQGQQGDRFEGDRGEGNLFETDGREVAAHGSFDAKAKDDAMIFGGEARAAVLMLPLLAGAALGLLAAGVLRRR